MPTKVLTNKSLQSAAVQTPWTSNLRHLLPVARSLLRGRGIQPAQRREVRKVVPLNQRIKWWNVVPGDQIRILGDKTNRLYQVSEVNKLQNKVSVRNTEGVTDETTQQAEDKKFHYSRCQLFVGNYEFPSPDPTKDPLVLPVFAKRLGQDGPKWNSRAGRFDWKRYAIKMQPTVPHLAGERVHIPWPTFQPNRPPTATNYDTGKEELSRVSYQPPTLTVASLNGPLPRPPPEQHYLSTLYNTAVTPAYGNEQPPLEIYLSKELSNPHSRAKKQARWQAYKTYKQALLKDFIAAEMNDLNTRTHREATADATWKWREQLASEEKAKRASARRVSAEKSGLKTLRKIRRARKQRQRLTGLVLQEELNQVVPNSAL